MTHEAVIEASEGLGDRMRSLIVIGAVSALFLAGCSEDGPAERAGKKIDRAVDKLSGKGPAEKAGERIDKAVDELKKN